jgi:hypothetical protein
LLNNTIVQDNGPRAVSVPVAPSKKKAPASPRLGKVSPALKKDVAVSKFLDSPAPITWREYIKIKPRSVTAMIDALAMFLVVRNV